MKDKVILTYSGGLETTEIITWLKENYDYDVICVCADVGQGNELDGLEERAKSSGASKLYIEDLVDEFVDDYVIPTVQANAVYENKYLLFQLINNSKLMYCIVNINDRFLLQDLLLQKDW